MAETEATTGGGGGGAVGVPPSLLAAAAASSSSSPAAPRPPPQCSPPERDEAEPPEGEREDDEEEVEPSSEAAAPGPSSAASCVTLSLPPPVSGGGCGSGAGSGGGGDDPRRRSRRFSDFRPVFTHQLFERERIPGWRPTAEAEAEARREASDRRRRRRGSSDRGGGGGAPDEPKETHAEGKGGEDEGGDLPPPHESFRLHRPDDGRLDVRVTLAPSCRKCAVRVVCASEPPMKAEGSDPGKRPSNSTEEEAREAKRPKVEDEESGSPSVDAKGLGPPEATSDDSKRVRFNDGAAENRTGEEGTGGTRTAMTAAEVVDRLGRALPRVAVASFDASEERSVDKDLYENVAVGVEGDCLPSPLGTVLCKYNRRVKGWDDSENEEEEEEGTFVVALVDGSRPEVAAYHSEVQKLAMFFIESASGVDVSSDEGGGFWRVLYLFRRHARLTEADVAARGDGDTSKESEESESNVRYSLAGYLTLFHFHAPFHKPRGGIVARICQALILPPYQRAGHGSELLDAVHDYAEGRYDDLLKQAAANEDGDDGPEGGRSGLSGAGPKEEIVEVNVEDPALAFAALRDATDYRRFKRRLEDAARNGCHPPLEWKYLGGFGGGGGGGDDGDGGKERGPDVEDDGAYFASLPESEAVRGGGELRITPQQVRVVHELHKLEGAEQYVRGLRDSLQKSRDSDAAAAAPLPEQKREVEGKIEEARRGYRLLVKKNLLKARREELGAIESKEGRKAKLAEWFERTERRHRAILRIEGPRA